ncbi:hypothetical protein TVAG_430460 [Trichomonas vaginalis G3]|uniref:Uncharacterized protein n=1 Tax=Trichomonas vaginalis (strain ATCC PRA-98 / G3) TaxID=412133 RepID=A2E372_TRIV3|nr:A-type inclusion protein-related family [Trichomonas vaginalis G3]EAY12882.1 hypothetical protein TVAG_430460 [Trichomonas vaginalis G3]KAI5491949.1 A-type inclusion protein-related family [Trichomonas vaginalis G3]|eukprot:XP_001325105.1 hypothetical protein [Trichomonas vaginalis G3]
MDDAALEQIIAEQIVPLQEQINSLQQENQSLREHISNLQLSSNVDPGEIQKLREENNTMYNDREKLSREKTALEEKINALNSKLRLYEDQVQRQNSEATSRINDAATKDIQITTLRKEAEKNQMTIKKQMQQLTQNLEEKKAMQKDISDLIAKNEELQNVTEEFMKRDQTLLDAFQDMKEQLTVKDNEIADIQRRCQRYENKLRKYDKNAVTTTTQVTAGGGDLGKTTPIDDEMSQQLLNYKKQNRELRERIMKLQEEERRAGRLMQAVEGRQRQIDHLQDLLNQNEQELLQYKHSSEDFANQIAIYREEKQMYAEESQRQIEAIKKELEEYRNSSEQTKKILDDTRLNIEEKTNEINELRILVSKYEKGEFGLPAAIDELKELRAMVQIREKHIAELIAQVNSMDKIIQGLVHELGKDFDLNDLLKNLDGRIAEDEQARIDRATRELNAYLKEMRENPPLGNMKVIVEQDEGYVMSFRDAVDRAGTMLKRNSKRKGKKRRNEPKDDFSFTQKESVPSSPSSVDDSELNKTKTKKGEKSPIEPISHVDVQVQAGEDPIPPDFVEINPDERDEWVANLQKQYLNVQKQLKAALNENATMKARIQELEELLRNRESQLENNKAENEELKQRLQKLGAEYAELTSLPPPQATTEPKPIKVVPQRPKEQLFISTVPQSYSVQQKEISLQMQTAREFFLYPTPEEKRILDSREKERQDRLKKNAEDMADLQKMLDDYARRMKQKDTVISDSQDTIERLEKQLQEQRESFKQRLRDIQDEAARNLEARLKEYQEMQNAANGGFGPDGDYSKLPEVAKRLKALNSENESLRDRIASLEELLRSQREVVDDYRMKMAAAEKKAEDDDENRVERGQPDSKLTAQYTQKLQRQNAELKKKVAFMKDQLDHARAARSLREDLSDSRNGTGESTKEMEQLERVTAQMKSYKAKYIEMKALQEEQVLKLEKEKENNERLKAMLQKREQSLAKLTDKYNQFKHQNEKLKAALAAKNQ